MGLPRSDHLPLSVPHALPVRGELSLCRGTYRIIYRINEDKHTVEIHSVRHRRDSYRT
jgi:mRNA interferase RelE/StbE